MNKLREFLDKHKELKGYQNWRPREINRYALQDYLMHNAEAIADLIDAATEVIRISDRKHDAWDKAKEALDKLEETK